MRLINADELKKEFPHDEDWDFPVNTNGYVIETINRMPTVDAIPIEWLYEYLHKRYDYANATKYLCAEYFLDRVIDDWRKENESNSNM